MTQLKNNNERIKLDALYKEELENVWDDWKHKRINRILLAFNTRDNDSVDSEEEDPLK